MLPGEGAVDWRAFADALDDAGYAGPFTYEVRIGGTPAERLRAIEGNFLSVFAAAGR